MTWQELLVQGSRRCDSDAIKSIAPWYRATRPRDDLARLIACIEDLNNEKQRRHLSQFIVVLYGVFHFLPVERQDAYRRWLPHCPSHLLQKGPLE